MDHETFAQTTADEQAAATAVDWTEAARRLGADGAATLPAGAVVVARWPRLKCEYGCEDYGTTFSCPPFAPDPERFAGVLAEYRRALLVWVEAAGAEPARARRRLHGALLDLEREALLAGLTKAFALTEGPCPWCGDEPCLFAAGCRHPRKRRPAMSACGIDTFATAAAAGLDLRVATDEGAPYRLVGLLLLD
jgi:predicted metal-binding protein